MCRMTAYLGDPIRVSTPLLGGEHSLFRQAWEPRELIRGSVNADGWGVVWYGEHGPARLVRAQPVWHMGDDRSVLETQRSPLVLAALRNATEGLPVSEDAVPPLLHGRWSFVLNGYVPSFRTRHMRALRSSLPDHLYAEIRGASDAETIFLRLVSVLEAGGALGEALDGGVRSVMEAVAPYDEECHFTALLSDGIGLALVRTSNRDEVNSLYRIDGASLAPSGVLIASEPLDDSPGWESLPAHEVVEINP